MSYPVQFALNLAARSSGICTFELKRQQCVARRVFCIAVDRSPVAVAVLISTEAVVTET